MTITPSLPPGLTPAMVRRAVEYIEREASELVFIYYEQRNAFSGVVSMFGTKGLASISPYEPNPHRFKAQAAFPDLIRRGAPSPPPPSFCLESKGSIRPWALQAHYDHEGWYIVWRYLVDDSLTLTGKPVVVWRVHVAYLRKEDWKYEKSEAGEKGGGRTHTFGVREPAKVFADKAVYDRDDVRLLRGKPVPANGL